MAVDTARVEKLRKQPINGQSMKRLVEAGLTWLRTNQQTVNALNVFPGPGWRYRHEHGADHAIGLERDQGPGSSQRQRDGSVRCPRAR